MSEIQVNKLIAKVFNDLADTLTDGYSAKRPNIAITALGSEHGEDNVINGALRAIKSNIDVTVIGSKKANGIKLVPVSDEKEAHNTMEKLLNNKEVDAAVTMHYPFPIGVSTVGRIITPAKGKEMFIATTTGTASNDRIEGMILNAIYGIITAKACGIENPSVGILNVDGARQTELALKKLKDNGYDINFATSLRSDGGIVMRGNDLMTASCDVMVTDPLTGNLMLKIFSSYTTGGSYESLGYGYGPGIGEGYDKIIMIISRASGEPVIEGAIKYAAQLVNNNLLQIAKKEFESANKAGLKEIIKSINAGKKSQATDDEEVTAPPKLVVTEQISGIEIMDLEDAVKKLWKASIYAESGMGCTGPIILVNQKDITNAKELLTKLGYISD